MKSEKKRRRRASLKAVAQRAGVSVTAVSQTLRGIGRISPDTRERILAAANELHYVHNRRAASMRTGESSEVGLLIHNIADPFYAELTKGVNSYLEERGFLIYLLDADYDAERQDRFLRATVEGHAAGLLWCPASYTEQTSIDWVRKASIPTVTLLHSVARQSFDHISVDNRGGATQATEHLCDLGHRNIAFIGAPASSQSRRVRYEAHIAVLENRGVPVKPEFSRAAPTNRGGSAEVFAELFAAHPELTAVVACDDTTAFGIMLAMQKLGMTPGKEISVVGFNDLPEAKHWSPALTTVAVRPRELGVELAKTLLHRREDLDAEPHATLWPVELVVRESTGPLPERAGQ